MKSIVLIILIVVFISCSSENQEKIDSLSINPPSWIQGTWTIKGEALGVHGLRFTNNAFFKIDESEAETNVMFAYVLLQGLGEDVIINEFITQNNYGIKFSYSRDEWYRFTRISNQEISWDNPLGSIDPVVYNKE